MNTLKLINEIRKLTFKYKNPADGCKMADILVELVRTYSGEVREEYLRLHLRDLTDSKELVDSFIEKLPELEKMNDLWRHLWAHEEARRL